VRRRVQLKRARFRENGFIEGKNGSQRRDIELGISTELRGGDYFRDMRQGLGQESACQEGGRSVHHWAAHSTHNKFL